MTEIPDSPFSVSQLAFALSESIEPRIKICVIRCRKFVTHLSHFSISVAAPILQFSPFGGRLLLPWYLFLIQVNKAHYCSKKKFG
jgi:hypothetical protein